MDTRPKGDKGIKTSVEAVEVNNIVSRHKFLACKTNFIKLKMVTSNVNRAVDDGKSCLWGNIIYLCRASIESKSSILYKTNQ